MTSAKLKYIAIITMFIDHIGEFIFSDLYGFDSMEYMICKIIGRIAFPIFAFLLVEGLKKTKNKKKYFFNLLIFALISEIPFDLAVSGKYIDFEQQNIFFTLLTNLTILYIIDKIKIKNVNIKILFELFIVTFFSIVSFYFKFDYLFFAPWIIYTYYKFYGNKKILFLVSELSFFFEFDSLVHIGNILIYLYNGERGKQNKYFFYLFYPIHIIIIYLIKIFLINL